MSRAAPSTCSKSLHQLPSRHPHCCRPQLCLLLGGAAAGDPLLSRLLRAAAGLLSPHTAVLGGTAASSALRDDPLAPRLAASASRADGEGQAGGVAHGSVLLTVGNRGIVVVETEQLNGRWVEIDMTQSVHCPVTLNDCKRNTIAVKTTTVNTRTTRTLSTMKIKRNYDIYVVLEIYEDVI